MVVLCSYRAHFTLESSLKAQTTQLRHRQKINNYVKKLG